LWLETHPLVGRGSATDAVTQNSPDKSGAPNSSAPTNNTAPVREQRDSARQSDQAIID